VRREEFAKIRIDYIFSTAVGAICIDSIYDPIRVGGARSSLLSKDGEE